MPSDFTKDVEGLIEDTVQAGRQYLGEVTPEMSPRPVDTTKVKPQDARWDYDNRGTDYWPRLAQNELTRAVSEGGNLGDALIALLKHDAGMRKSDGTRG